MSGYKYWARTSPGHIVYLIDLSASMTDKIDGIIDVMHIVLTRIMSYCVVGNTVRERVFVTIIGYNHTTYIIWKNVSALEIAKMVVNIKRHKIPMFDKETWFKPQYQRCMRLAFEEAKKDIDEWIAKLTAAEMRVPAPIVINITDGYPYEGNEKTWEQVSQETLQAARAIMNTRAEDGYVQLYNIYFGSQNEEKPSIFPSQRPNYHGDQFLYDASSVMDASTISSFSDYLTVDSDARCLVLNKNDPEQLACLIGMISTWNGLN